MTVHRLPRAVLGILVAFALALSCAPSRREIPLVSWEAYKARKGGWPYLLRFDTPEGALLYFGARHTYDPGDGQLQQIEALWECFRPTIAFNEGGNPPVEPSRDQAVKEHGEPGLVRFLAARDDLPVASLDPSRAEEVAHFRRRWSAEDVKLFFVLRAVAQTGDRLGPDAVDTELLRVLPIFNSSPGLGAAPRSVDEVATAFERRFPDVGGYRQTPQKWYDPVRSDTWINRMARQGSDFRDRAIVQTLVASVKDHQRVFAVVGGTHVVMQEPALEALLGTRARRLGNDRCQ